MRNTRNERRRLIYAEVLLIHGSVYNGGLMRIANGKYYPLVLVLSLGLVYSQVCSVICAFSNCSTPAKVAGAETVEQSGHCHQKRASSEKKQTPEDQHKCPAYGSSVSVLPSEAISTVVSHYAWQLLSAELVPSLDILFDLAGNGFARGGHFRSPPQRPLFTILRI